MSSRPTSQYQVQEPQPPELKLPHPQFQSAFLSKLPFEIRHIIYTHVFGHSLIHLLDMGRRLAHFRCPNKIWDGHRHGIEGLNGCPILNIEDHPNNELLSLCKTCRMMYVCPFLDYAHQLTALLTSHSSYNETLPHLYSDPTFTIWQPDLLLTISSKSPLFLSHVRSLHFSVAYYRFPQLDPSPQSGMAIWRKLCFALSKMENLHNLRIHIHQDYFFVEPRDLSVTAEYVTGLLEPLKEINMTGKGGVFEVTIGWTLTAEERDMLGEVPFQIVEAGERAYAGVKLGGNPYG